MSRIKIWSNKNLFIDFIKINSYVFVASYVIFFKLLFNKFLVTFKKTGK